MSINEMELIKAQEPETLAKVYKLYMEAFPAEERKEFSFMEAMQSAGSVEMLAIENAGAFAGLAITVSHAGLVLLDYFAVENAVRGGGVGTKALALLKDRYKGKKFFLEIEDSNEEADNRRQRMRRKGFYLRNGMSEMNFQAEVAGIRMEILTDGCTLDFDEYKSVYDFGYGVETGRTIKGV